MFLAIFFAHVFHNFPLIFPALSSPHISLFFPVMFLALFSSGFSFSPHDFCTFLLIFPAIFSPRVSVFLSFFPLSFLTLFSSCSSLYPSHLPPFLCSYFLPFPHSHPFPLTFLLLLPSCFSKCSPHISWPFLSFCQLFLSLSPSRFLPFVPLIFLILFCSCFLEFSSRVSCPFLPSPSSIFIHISHHFPLRFLLFSSCPLLSFFHSHFSTSSPHVSHTCHLTFSALLPLTFPTFFQPLVLVSDCFSSVVYELLFFFSFNPLLKIMGARAAAQEAPACVSAEQKVCAQPEKSH